MGDLQLFLQHLRQPEYIHVLLNPLPIYGMAAGAFMLALSMILRHSKEQVGSLVWLTLMGLATWLAIQYGHKGYDRVFSMSDLDAQQWLDVHVHRAEISEYVFYGTGIMALAALISMRWRSQVTRILSVVTLCLALISVGLGGWISQAGGQVRHSEFREGPPQPGQLPPLEERHSHGHEHEHNASER